MGFSKPLGLGDVLIKVWSLIYKFLEVPETFIGFVEPVIS
jgi:hypothetical protein